MAENFISTLPVFREEPLFAPSDKIGLWQNAKGTLGQLGRSLKLPKDPWSDPDEPIRAIPDPWAQARTFGEALLDTKHSMHDNVLGKWRGLLALFALRHLHETDYLLSPRAVKLDGDHIFARVMRELPPAVALGDLVDEWKKPHLVMLTVKGNTQPLAVTNPICLVSPGRSSHRVTIPGVAWAKGEIRDPLSADISLPITEIIVLETWLARLSDTVEAYGGRVALSIAQLLRDFANQCKAKLGDATLPVKHLDSDQQKLKPLFHHLWSSSRLETPADPATSSRTRLRLRRDADLGHLKGVILVDEAIGALPGFGAEHTFVWGTRTLAELLHEETFNATRKEASQLGYWLITADDLFADRAMRLGKEAMVSSHPPGLQDVILPLRPLALLLDENPVKRIGGQSQSSRISVALEVDLGSGPQEATHFLLTRHYSTDSESGEALLVDEADWELYNASLWPNFRAESWSTYLARFAYQEAHRGHSLRPHSATSSRLICAEVKDASNGNEAVIRLAELNRGAMPRGDERRFTRSESLVEKLYEDIQISTDPFDAILYFEAAPDRQDAPVGMILTQLESVQTEANKSVAAVDFGTTNTVACLSSDQPIVFKARLVFPITYTSPETNRASLNNARHVLSKFWPAEKRTTPTPTVAFTRKGGSNATRHAAFRNIIYFHSHQPYAVNGEEQEARELTKIAVHCKFNLKWSEEATHTEAARDFLEQFMLMVAAEATVQGFDSRRLRWRFSIPDSLTGRPRETFQKHLNTITGRISTDVPRDEEPALAPLYSEGLAAASFILLKAGFSNEQLNVVLDIGGGTTDATIWDRENVLWNGSFRIAGQHFFTRALTQNSSILREIGLGQWANLLDGATVTDVPRFEENKPQIAEILFSDERLQKAIDANWDARLDLDVGKPLRLTALVALGGIAWYTGKVARQLVADGALRKDSLDAQAFALCGRGAGMFKKIHGVAAEEESDVTRVLRLFSVAAGMESVPLPQMFSSPDAKLEVVRGMIGGEYEKLIDASAKRGFEKAKSYLPAGLGLTFDSGDPLPADAMIGNDMLAEKVRDVDMAEFDAFIAALRTHGGIRLDPLAGSQQGARKQVQGAVRQQLELERLEQEAGRALEPPFISGLRKLVDILASPADQRKDKLKVDFV